MMSPSNEPVQLTVLPPEQTLHHAQPLPNDEDLVIEGLTDAEWEAFARARTDR